MQLELLSGAYSVCRLTGGLADVDWSGPLTFACRTPEEFSLVCETARVPGRVSARQDGFRALRVAGTLDFSLIGVLSRLTDILASEGISVFCVSTYDTDYLLVRECALNQAVCALRAHDIDVK